MSRFVAQKTPQFFATMETLSEAYKEFYESECPIDAFPKVIRDVAKTYSAARNLPMELLCFCACGILSGAMGRVFKAKKRSKRRIHANREYLCPRRGRKLHRQKREHSSSFL